MLILKWEHIILLEQMNEKNQIYWKCYVFYMQVYSKVSFINKAPNDLDLI